MKKVFDISTMNPKQKKFFKSRRRFIAYGGARGGGKSWSVQRKAPLLALKYPGIKILLLRRTYRDLERNHVRELTPLIDGIAKYSRTDKCFYFPNGSMIELGYCAAESDVLQYQGQEYDIIFIDEATQFTEYQFATLTACLRGANDFPKRMYLTCNPGGVGHEWVKRLFVSRRYKKNEVPEDYEFISATVDDNKALAEHDPGYVMMLDNLPDELRAAWRDGNWDMLAGRYFDEFDRSVHTCEPFKIPEHWRRYRSIDYGLDCLACVWVAIDEHGNYFVYREYAKPDMTISAGCAEIKALSEGERIEYTVLPPDMWGRSQESAKTKAELFCEGGLCDIVRGGNDREAGWLALKELLKIHQNGEGRQARLNIFKSCTQLCDSLPALQRDIHKPTDCMTEPHDITHLPDALRYFALRYTMPSKPPKAAMSREQRHKREVMRRMRRRPE